MTIDVLQAHHKSKKAEDQAASAILTARAMPVNTMADKKKAVEYIRVLMDMKDEVQEISDSMVRPLEASVKEIKKFFRSPVTMLDTAIGAVKAKCMDFLDRDLSERSVRELNLAAEALKKRQALMDEALRLRDKGKVEEALEREMEAEMCVAVVQIDEDSSDGSHTRVTWDGVVDNFDLLVKAVASGAAPSELLKPDTTAIRKMASAVKGTQRIPGISWRSDKSFVVRR